MNPSTLEAFDIWRERYCNRGDILLVDMDGWMLIKDDFDGASYYAVPVCDDPYPFRVPLFGDGEMREHPCDIRTVPGHIVSAFRGLILLDQ